MAAVMKPSPSRSLISTLAAALDGSREQSLTSPLLNQSFAG